MNAQQIVESFQAKGYTPTQVVNAITRREAHLVRHGNAAEKATYTKAVVLARGALDAAHAAGFVPCQQECMYATGKACECHCGGKNHGGMGAPLETEGAAADEASADKPAEQVELAA